MIPLVLRGKAEETCRLPACRSSMRRAFVVLGPGLRASKAEMLTVAVFSYPPGADHPPVQGRLLQRCRGTCHEPDRGHFGCRASAPVVLPHQTAYRLLECFIFHPSSESLPGFVSGAMSSNPALAILVGLKTYRIGAAVCGLKAEFRQLWVDALKEHPAVKGGLAQVTVFDGKYDALTRNNPFETMVTQKFDAIIFVPIDIQAGAEAVHMTAVAHIPVIGFEHTGQ